MNKTFLIVLLLAFSLPTLSKTRRLIAEVSILRGKVSQLAPGERLARNLKVGDKVREDTSILTGDKSFVQLKYDDGSRTSLGPNSKIVVVKMDKKGNGVLNLLKGRVRNKIKQDYEGKKKFYVRTRNAALGVRGTEFETIYNSENNLTSLLTYKGEVAMVKTKDNIDKSKTNLKRAKRVVRKFDNKIILEEEPQLIKVDEKKIEGLLEKDAVLVKQGQFSQTVAKIETVSKPIIISPVQMNAMYKNQTFQEKEVKEVKAAEIDPTKEKLSIVPEKQEIPPEGIYDPKNKVFAAKAGGFLDVKTGLYVPPSAEALFDQKNKVYYASNVGAIDSETGQYEPPLGLALDPVKGFVEKKFTSNAPQTLIAEVKAKKEKLNKSLASDVVQSRGKAQAVTPTGSVRPLSNRELISKNIFSISYMPFSQTYDHEGDTFLGTTRNFEADSNFDIKLSIDYASGSRWQPVTSYTFRNVEFPSSQRGTYDQQGKKLTELSVGVRYSMSPRWSSTFEAKLDQQYFLHHSGATTTTTQFTRITIPKVQLGFKGTVFHVGRLFTELGAYFGSNLPKSSGDQKLGIGLNYGVNAEVKYWIFQQSILAVGLFNDYESISVEGSTRVYEADTKRSSSGLRMTLSTFF